MAERHELAVGDVDAPASTLSVYRSTRTAASGRTCTSRLLAKKAAQPLSSLSTSAAAQLERTPLRGVCSRGPCRSPAARVRLSNEAIHRRIGGTRTRVKRTTLGAVAAGVYPRRERPSPSPAIAGNLLAGADPECFLCQAAPAGDDRQRLVVDRGVHTVTLLNRYPYNNGHLLVAPQRHLARLDELGRRLAVGGFADDRPDGGVLEKVLQPQGFNIGVNLGRAAGAGVPGHLHWHIVPRWIGDTNFMPTIAGVHTIPQSLEACGNCWRRSWRNKVAVTRLYWQNIRSSCSWSRLNREFFSFADGEPFSTLTWRELYGTTTKRLNEQVKRNQARFPDGFHVPLTPEEAKHAVAICDRIQTQCALSCLMLHRIRERSWRPAF